MGRRALVVDWNGKDLPSELHQLPAGRYLLEPVEDAAFTEEGDRGVELALAQYCRGQTIEAAQVRLTLDSLLKR